MLASLFRTLSSGARGTAAERAAALAASARASLGRGNERAAARAARRALELSGNCTAARHVLASLELKGDPYIEVLARIHALRQPATYVEIGVWSGESLALAGEHTVAIGVDPEPRINRPLGPRTRVVAQTSDDFFAGDVRAALGGRGIELAFIDGMHHFEYALRDFINIERLAEPNAVVLIHDTFPQDEITASRERKTEFWSGDVWRLVLALRRHRPDLDVRTLACPPTGLALVRRLDPASRALAERYDAIVGELLAVTFGEIAGRKAERLNLVDGRWAAIAPLLGPAR